MATAAFENLYHRRLVAETATKACMICYKPSSTVLISANQADYFYICPGHLNDSKFATAKDAEDIAKKKRDEEIEKEIEAVKAEFAEKMRKKMDRRKQKEHEKGGAKAKDEKKQEENDDQVDEKEKEAKLKELEEKKQPEKAKVEGPRIFELQKQFYQMRLQKKRDLERAKRDRERLRNGSAFPSVPKGDP